MGVRAVRRVIVESPYAASTPEGIEENIAYARACMADCLSRGEAPFASHLLYTQEGVLRDEVPEQRERGIEAGLAWGLAAEASVVYADLGITPGMIRGVRRAARDKRPVELRFLAVQPGHLVADTIQLIAAWVRGERQGN